MTTLREPLLTLREVRVLGEDGLQLGPLNAVFWQGQRLWVTFENPIHYNLLEKLLTGQTLPAGGLLDEPRPLLAASDSLLWDKMDLNQTVSGFLHSEQVPAHLWMEQRRRSVGVLVDRLQITPAQTRRAISHETEALRHRFWALQFLVSRAKLLMGRDLFALEDEAVRHALRSRWPDLPGTVLAACTQAQLPGPATEHLHLDAQGQGVVVDLTEDAE